MRHQSRRPFDPPTWLPPLRRAQRPQGLAPPGRRGQLPPLGQGQDAPALQARLITPGLPSTAPSAMLFFLMAATPSALAGFSLRLAAVFVLLSFVPSGHAQCPY